MPLNVTLASLLNDLRAETNRSLTPAHGAGEADHLKYLLRRTQQRIAEDNAWPHLTVNRDITFGIGQRYAAYPADLPFDAIDSVHVKVGSRWQPVVSGIGPVEFSTYDSEAAITGYPVLRWQHDPDTNSIEAWPVPNQTSILRLRGRRTLRPLINDADQCDLDSNLIVMFAAAEMLARSKGEDAALKLQTAQRLLRSLLGRQSKSAPFVIGGGGYGDTQPMLPGKDFIR